MTAKLPTIASAVLFIVSYAYAIMLYRRRRKADVRAQALASLPDSLYTFYNIYKYFLFHFDFRFPLIVHENHT